MHRTVFACARRACFLLAVSAAVPAVAQDYPARDVGGWTVAASKDQKGCFLTKTYPGEGGTTLLLGLDIDGTNRLSVLNDNWSIKPKERRRLTFKLTKGGYPNHAVVGMESQGKTGFVTNFDAKFPDHFATSKALHIDRADVPVERLALAASGAAIAEVRRCVWLLKSASAPATPEGARSGRVPKDPFAEKPKR